MTSAESGRLLHRYREGLEIFERIGAVCAAAELGQLSENLCRMVDHEEHAPPQRFADDPTASQYAFLRAVLLYQIDASEASVIRQGRARTFKEARWSPKLEAEVYSTRSRSKKRSAYSGRSMMNLGVSYLV